MKNIVTRVVKFTCNETGKVTYSPQLRYTTLFGCKWWKTFSEGMGDLEYNTIKEAEDRIVQYRKDNQTYTYKGEVV